MKKFEFSMQKILEYKTHLEDKEKTILAQMHSQCKKMYHEIDKIQKKYDDFKKMYAQLCERGITISEMAINRIHLDEMIQQIKQMLLQLREFEQEIDKQRNLVIDISKDKSSMGKLKDRQYDLYKEKQRNETELFIDSFVANTNHYANR